MTAKKITKSAKGPSSTKAAPKTTKSATGLLSRLKGALTKKPAATAPAKPAKSTPAGAKASTASKAAASKATPSKVAAPKSTAKKVGTSSAKQMSKAPAPSATSKPAPAVPVTATNHLVTKSTAKKARIASFSPNLTEDDIKSMSENDYMNDVQLEFFRRRLLQMRQEVLQREMDVKERLHEREVFADPADRATAEEEHWLDLRLRERESLLLRKVDDALRRIEAKEYGYCEKTGDPIGIPRLLARPTATVCVDVKGQDERVEAQYRDR